MNTKNDEIWPVGAQEHPLKLWPITVNLLDGCVVRRGQWFEISPTYSGLIQEIYAGRTIEIPNMVTATRLDPVTRLPIERTVTQTGVNLQRVYPFTYIERICDIQTPELKRALGISKDIAPLGIHILRAMYIPT